MAMVGSYVLVLIQCPDREWNADIHDNEDWAWQSPQKCLSAGFVLRNFPNQNLQRAFYVAGGAAVDHNSLLELDNCIVYTVEHHDKPKYGQFPLQVEVSVNVDFEFTKENFDYPLVEITRDVFPKDMAITPSNVDPSTRCSSIDGSFRSRQRK